MMKNKTAQKEITSIELDIAWPDDWHEVRDSASLTTRTQKWAARFDVEAKLVAIAGPGGGFPVYRFSGSQANLLRLARSYSGGDRREARFLVLGEE